MGLEKAAIEEREANWDRKAMAEGLRCSVCSTHIPYGDRDVFFRTGGAEHGMCGYCAHQAVKDD